MTTALKCVKQTQESMRLRDKKHASGAEIVLTFNKLIYYQAV